MRGAFTMVAGMAEIAPKTLTKKELQTENSNLKNKIKKLLQEIATLKIQPKISDESLVTETEALKFKVKELQNNKANQDKAYQILNAKHSQLKESIKL